MPFIYCITNKINDKKYVGKTASTIKQRWKEHCLDYTKPRCEKRPLYDAINKYGIENFEISELCECSIDELNEKELSYINELNTYHYGYNATKGGDGKILYDHSEIIELYLSGLTMKEVCSLIGCCEDTVYNVLKSNNIKARKNYGGIKVNQYSLSGEFIRTFESTADAGRWLTENGFVKKYCGGVRQKIGNVAHGKSKTAYKFRWAWDKDDI